MLDAEFMIFAGNLGEEGEKEKNKRERNKNSRSFISRRKKKIRG